jgi:ribosomal protein S18 acetylase RimI-like enzyme
MGDDDLSAVDAIWQEAFAEMRRSNGAEVTERSEEQARNDQARFLHLLRTDAPGCFVVEDNGEVVGFAQSHVRETTFGLAMLAVRPDHQDRHLGRTLLDAALAYGAGSRTRFIFSSSDPRALHRYVRAGFTLRPTVAFTGPTPQGAGPDGSLRISDGDASDLDLVASIDREVRGSARNADIAFWLSCGLQLVIDGRGAYAVIGPGRLTALGATDPLLASELLRALLLGFPEGRQIDAGWIVAEQDWAIRTASECGASLKVQGAMMTAGDRQVPFPYLPNGLFG